MQFEDVSDHFSHSVELPYDPDSLFHLLLLSSFPIVIDPSFTLGRQNNVRSRTQSLELDHLDLNLDLPLLSMSFCINDLTFSAPWFHSYKSGYYT